MSDEVGRPLLPFQMGDEGRIDLEKLAKDNGIPQEAMETLLQLLLENGNIIRTLVPFCAHCNEREGTYDKEEDLPDMFTCFYCGEVQTIQEAVIKEMYPVINPPGE